MSNFQCQQKLAEMKGKNINNNFNSDLGRDYYTIAQCARRVGSTPQSIYRWINKGTFVPVIKIGSTYRVKVDDFEAWIESALQFSQTMKEA